MIFKLTAVLLPVAVVMVVAPTFNPFVTAILAVTAVSFFTRNNKGAKL